MSLKQFRRLANIRNQGFEVDDDNEPDPANVLPPGAELSQGLKPGQVWGWDGIDRHHIVTPEKEEPSYADGWSPLGVSYFLVFLHYLPLTFFNESILVNTSEALESLGEPELVWGESLRFVGTWCMVATVSGYS